MANDLDVLRESFRAFGREVGGRAPTYRVLSEILAEDDDLLSLLVHAPEQQRRPVLLLAAIHDLVLEIPELPLAKWYPSITGEPVSGDPRPALRDAVNDYRSRVIEVVSSRHTQTNEVGRCAPLLIALAEQPLTRAIGLIDIGCSAGLNLHLDRFGYHFRGQNGPWEVEIDRDSQPLLSCDVRGRINHAIAKPQIGTRLGLDAHPIDVTEPDEVRWLEACVWPDQLDRLSRLRNAIAVARQFPVATQRGDAVEDLLQIVGEVPPHQHPVVINSWVLAYLSAGQRRQYQSVIDQIGTARDLTWIYMEAPADCPELDGPDDPDTARLTAVMRVDWRNGLRTVRHVGTMHPHGYWMHLAANQT